MDKYSKKCTSIDETRELADRFASLVKTEGCFVNLFGFHFNMKISNNIFVNKIYHNPSKISFKNTQPNSYHPSIKTLKCGDDEVSGQLVRYIDLTKRKENEAIKGFIIKDLDNGQYYACAGDEALCKMRLSKEDGYIYIDELFGQNNRGEYKGMGTELVKLAIDFSKKEGCKGEVFVVATGSFPFYYKNNFRISNYKQNALIQNAILDYLSRNNIEAYRLWPTWLIPLMELLLLTIFT